MKRKQPDKCERCGATLAIEGEMCYQRNCTYIKKTSIVQDIAVDLADFTINEVQSGEGSISQQLEDNTKILNGGLDFTSKNVGTGKIPQTSAKGENDGDDSFLGDLQGGCIWGFFKLLWNIITFPIKLILRILSLFD